MENHGQNGNFNWTVVGSFDEKNSNIKGLDALPMVSYDTNTFFIAIYFDEANKRVTLYEATEDNAAHSGIAEVLVQRFPKVWNYQELQDLTAILVEKQMGLPDEEKADLWQSVSDLFDALNSNPQG